MVRIKDIADYVGVSATTVSNVLHGKNQRVSPETRQRIEKAIKDLGYIPNMGALMLAQEKSCIIGVILFAKGIKNEPTMTDPYYGSLVGYLEQYIKERHHYMLMLTVTNVEDIIRQSKAWDLDGLISCNMLPDVLSHLYSLSQIPLVSLDAYMENKPSFINIGTDDFGGGYLMGQYLASMGHRHVLMVSDNDQGVEHHRWLGLQKGLSEAGIPMTGEQHLIVSNLYEERLVQYKKHKNLLKQQTVLFFSSDYYAMEACFILRKLGFRIPEDLSVAGFDDLFSSRFITPALTTIRQSIDRKAKLAVDALFSLMDGTGYHKTVLPVELIRRDSVRKL